MHLGDGGRCIMYGLLFLGILLIVLGLSGLVVSQVLLYKWMKKFNKEWMDKR